MAFVEPLKPRGSIVSRWRTTALQHQAWFRLNAALAMRATTDVRWYWLFCGLHGSNCPSYAVEQSCRAICTATFGILGVLQEGVATSEFALERSCIESQSATSSAVMHHYSWKAKAVFSAGPALSPCSCIGPRAIVFGKVVNFCQIPLELENSVDTPCKSHCLQTIILLKKTMNFLFRTLSNVLKSRPVTSLWHQEGRRVFWEEPKFFELCPIF